MPSPASHGWQQTLSLLAHLPSVLQALAGALGARQAGEPYAPRITVAGLPGGGKSTLVNRLYGWELSEPSAHDGEEPLGLFTVVELGEPTERLWPFPTSPSSYTVGAWADPMPDGAWPSYAPALPPEAALLLFVVDGIEGMTPAAFRWLSRLRARERPLIVVLSKADALPDAESRATALARRLALPVVAVSARTGKGLVETLLPRIVELDPALLVPLGAALDCFRGEAARRVVREAALGCGLIGLEPLPLADIPLQLALEVRLVQQLAALYGRAGARGMSGIRREMGLALLVGLLLRYSAQQLAKFVPWVGWALSGLLGMVGVWGVGQIAARSFAQRAMQGEPRLRRHGVERWWGKGGGGPPVPRWPRRRASRIALDESALYRQEE